MIGTYDPQAARRHLAEAIELARAVGDLTVLASARNAMAYTHVNAGDLDDGVVAFEEVLQLTRLIGIRTTRCHAVDPCPPPHHPIRGGRSVLPPCEYFGGRRGT
jgi:hypothetical protein